jgi:hypothetical protein
MHSNHRPADRGSRPPRRYDAAVQAALILLWEASDRACGKRLKTLLPVLLPALEHHQYLMLQPAIRTELCAVSAATIDRLLRDSRSRKQAGRDLRAPTILRRPIRPGLDSPWADPKPGYLQMQLTHADRRRANHRVRTLTVTDAFSGWAQCATVPDWQQGSVVKCLDTLLGSLPFTPRGLALDDKSIALKDWLMRAGSPYPMEIRGVSRHAGRSRTAHPGQDTLLSRLSAITSVYTNVFRSAFDSGPVTPCARLLASGALSEVQQNRLRDHARSLDPLKLLAGIRALNLQLRARFARKPRSLVQAPSAAGQNRRRPQPGRRPPRARSWSTHANVFAGAWPAIQAWLRGDPEQTGKDLLERLQRKYPGMYRDGQLRSLQRRVKRWRRMRPWPGPAAMGNAALIAG